MKGLVLLLVLAGLGGCRLAANRPPAPNSGGVSTIGQVVKVADGDSLTVQMEAGPTLKIRLCGIDAPEKAQPLGIDSKRNLEKMALGKRVAVTEIERDRYGRTVAEVFVLGQGDLEVFVNGEQLTAGLAYHYQQYSKNCPNRPVLVDSEQIGQSKKLGVWSGRRNYQFPWEFRKAKREH